MNIVIKRFIAIFVLILFIYTLNAASVMVTALKSAVVPGWGELSVGNKTGYIFIATEVLFWSGQFYLNDQSALILKQSKQYAYNHANMSSYHFSDDVWLLMEKYDSSGFSPNGYNDYIRRNAYEQYQDEVLRDAYLRENLLPDDVSWNWESDEQRGNYRKYRNDSLRFKDYAKAASGTIIANHILSFLNAIRVARKANKENNMTFYTDFDTQMTPYLHIDYKF